MKNRIEILKNGIWTELELFTGSQIKYNSVINRIGSTKDREISHTNTFKLPMVFKNVSALDLNRFNSRFMSRALNTKYLSRYYVGDRLSQVGYLVINNTDDGNININFIDEALSLIDIWGDVSFKKLLQDNTIFKKPDYVAAIAEMQNYVISKTSVFPSLSEVGTRGYNLALFPNNLNAIGEKFQVNSSELRIDDAFNSYQSRPIFNMKSLFDMSCEAFGYTPIYDESVDWSIVEKTYMVNKGLGEDGLEDEDLVQNVSTIDSIEPYSVLDRNLPSFSSRQWWFVIDFALASPLVNAVAPNDIPNFVMPDLVFHRTSEIDLGEGIVYGVDLANNPDGEVYISTEFEANVATLDVDFLVETELLAVWENSTAGEDVLWSLINSPSGTLSGGVSTSFVKSDLTPPINAGALIGVSLFCTATYINIVSVGGELLLRDTTVTEESFEDDAVSYDEFGQFSAENVDLTYASTDEKLKSLLVAYMQKDGILLDINKKTGDVLFFSYRMYQRNVDEGKYGNWSDYLLKYSTIKYNTNYGNKYGRVNEIGLQKPYEGNIFNYPLDNHNSESKYKTRAKDSNKLFNDVTGAAKINNTNHPYTQFSCSELSLVEHDGYIEGLQQIRYIPPTVTTTPSGAEVTNHGIEYLGVIPSLARIVNVNYGVLPKGIEEWYRIVDESVRIEAMFLIPFQKMMDLKLYEPVYIEYLGGFFIIEEVAEYVDATIPVNVKLIKLKIN